MIIKLSQLPQIRKSLRDKKIVFAGGTFDLFHRGHVESFKNLMPLGDVVVIAVSTDKRVKQRKGSKRPIISEKGRLALVDSVRYVDYSLLAPEPQKGKPVPTMLILTALRPDIFVTVDKKWESFRKDIESLGVELRIIPRGRIDSTTRLIKRIVQRYSK